MGWMNDAHPGHEGYVVGLVPVGDRQDDRWRELGVADKELGTIRLLKVQVACDCGWRSCRMDAPLHTTWSPFHVWFDEVHNERQEMGFAIWMAHLASEIDAYALIGSKRFVSGRQVLEHYGAGDHKSRVRRRK